MGPPSLDHVPRTAAVGKCKTPTPTQGILAAGEEGTTLPPWPTAPAGGTGGRTQDWRLTGRVANGSHAAACKEVGHAEILFVQDSALPATFPWTNKAFSTYRCTTSEAPVTRHHPNIKYRLFDVIILIATREVSSVLYPSLAFIQMDTPENSDRPWGQHYV
jgi:hypothetical protein